ncbi:MAG: 2-C-methyl-D-erythritol 4-phosphate cytidylyltransferase [Deltaproteobacteria bacterium]|nr:2-C-methyl-D-erythritol 4-phosphate cytidylyltransferase [Deltaproteobacteria bacterium]MBI4223572.1 2-C-methyl-D-erythritol 4-phosphate cytidylyltransferase [Deltaproteobacteria bacterium]
MKAGVIIVAAGRGSRLDSALPKAFVPLGGKPLYQHSLAVFQGHPGIGEIVLVVPPESGLQFLEGVQIVSGGRRRQDSVAAGLQALDPKHQTVLIHDAARPFVSPALVDRLIAALKQGRNAIAALSVADTVKQVDGGKIVRTIDRQILRAAQTPQGFQLSVLREVLQEAEQRGWEVTDEAMLLEKLNIPVYWVEGDPLNIKITTKEDLRLGEIVYANRSRL